MKRFSTTASSKRVRVSGVSTTSVGLHLQRRDVPPVQRLIQKATVCTSSVRVDLETNSLYIFCTSSVGMALKLTLCWRNKQLLSTSTPYAGGANNCFLNQPVRQWYIPTLEVQPYTGGTSRLLSKSNPYAQGTNSCILKPPLRCRYKQVLSESTPYAGGTNSCSLNQPLRWWYIPTLVVLTPPTSPLQNQTKHSNIMHNKQPLTYQRQIRVLTYAQLVLNL